MERKNYMRPEIVSMIDLDAEVCQMVGETRWRVKDSDGNTIAGGGIYDEDDIDDWSDWNFAKRSTLWEEDEQDN